LESIRPIQKKALWSENIRPIQKNQTPKNR
jgi:hypothetical protein